jgi:tetratricopeptide (TPR) repeat protein
MTDLSNPKELLQRGQAAARVGHRAEAREMLRRAVAITPDSTDAWLALAGVEDDPAEKIACFEKVLALDPENVEARLGLEMLQRNDPVSPTQQQGPQTLVQPDGDGDLEAVLSEASRRLEEAVGLPAPGEVPPDDQVLYCANHPNVETMLRCNRCGKPICTRCAIQTPVGYRCRECVAGQQATFYTGGVPDYVIAAVIALLLGGAATFLMSLLGYWFFALILGAPVGIGIAEAVRFAVRRRRSRYLWLTVGGGMVVGALPALLLSLVGFNLWSLLSIGLFLLLAVGAAVARLR